MLSRLTFSATFLMALAVPALADPLTAEPSPMVMLRDSDGMVISVLDWRDGHPGVDTDGGVWPIALLRDSDGIVISVLNWSDGHPEEWLLYGQPEVMNGSELLVVADAGGQVLDVGGVSYRVETDGRQVWLRDIATGKRHATSRNKVQVAPDAQGLVVNPASFALD